MVNAVAKERQPNQVRDNDQLNNGDRCHPHGFNRETTNRIHAFTYALFNQAIEAKRGGQDQGNPGNRAVTEGQDNNGNDTHAYSNPLQFAQALFQHRHAQDHRQDGVNEITQGGFNNLVVQYGNDEHLPVDVNQNGS